MKKSFAQLKRDLVLGRKVECLNNTLKPEKIGMVREIVKVQTNCICMRDESHQSYQSWLYYPKSASEVNYEDDVFTFTQGDWIVSYRIMPL